MEPFSYFFLFFLPFLLISLGFSFWNMIERRNFLCFEGQLKRGLKIWADPLSWEMSQWLETMSVDFRDKQGFIRKEGREVLVVVENQSLWGMLNRRRQWPYIGYINLTGPERQFEFRILWSNLAIWLVLIPTFSVFFFAIATYPYLKNGFELALPCFFPFIFLAFLAGSVWFNHYRERKRLLDFLQRVMEQKF